MSNWKCEISLGAALGLCSSVVVGCAQRPLDELLAEQASGGPLAGGQIATSAMAEFFPLVDGARWVYVHDDPEQGIRRETSSLVQALDGDQIVYDLGTTRDDSDETDEQRSSWDGERLLRRRRTESNAGAVSRQTEYDPGFTRFNLGWNRTGATDAVSYERIETDADGSTTRTERNQQFRVLAVDVELEVPYGKVGPCLYVERSGDGDRTLFWFARGVGLVRELNDETQVVEELEDVWRE